MFSEYKIFLGISLHSEKCLENFFQMFGCVLKNALENVFSTNFSHFPNFQTNIIIENSNI